MNFLGYIYAQIVLAAVLRFSISGWGQILGATDYTGIATLITAVSTGLGVVGGIMLGQGRERKKHEQSWQDDQFKRYEREIRYLWDRVSALEKKVTHLEGENEVLRASALGVAPPDESDHAKHHEE